MKARVGMYAYPGLPGRWYLRASCDECPDCDWRFDSPSVDPSDWERVHTVAYGHICWAHGKVLTHKVRIYSEFVSQGVQGWWRADCACGWADMDLAAHTYALEAAHQHLRATGP